MAVAGSAFINLEPDLDGFFTQIDSALAPLTGKFGKFGTAAAAGLAGVGVAAGAAVVALYKIGESFDDAYDTIRVQTGATGKELEGLEGAFKNVVSQVPTDFDSAATAVGSLNSRLGLTGKPLQSLSKQMLELSRITETDLETNIESVTRVFGDWGVKTREQGPALDMLFRASQETGVGVSRLSDVMTKFGSPLRQLGFTFAETAGLVGKFEKEGVNTELVLGSMRIALGKMATEGVKDPAKALEMLTRNIKNAGSAGEANKLALETFGARAGPDMAAAIREGRFELGDLFDVIKNGDSTVMKAGRQTMDFTEQWTLFKNRAMVALEPIAIRVFDALGKGMKWLNDNGPAIMGKLRDAVGWVKTAFTDLKPAFDFIVARAKSTFETLLPIFKGAFKIIGGIVDVFIGLIHGDFGRMWKGIKGIFAGGFDIIKGIFKAATAPIRALASKIGDLIVKGFEVVKSIPGKIKDLFGNALDAIGGFISKYADKAAKIGKAIVEKVVNFVKDLPGKIKDLLSEAVDKVGGAVSGFADKAGRIGNAVVDKIVGFVKDLPSKIGDLLSRAAGEVGNWVGDFADQAGKLGKAVVSGIGNGLSKLPGIIGNAIKNSLGVVGNLAKSIANTLIGVLNDAIPNSIPMPGPVPDLNLPDNPIPSFASGVKNFAGGVALVGEEGPELALLPRGTDLLPNAPTEQILSRNFTVEAVERQIAIQVVVEDEAVDRGKIKVIANGVAVERDRAAGDFVVAGRSR